MIPGYSSMFAFWLGGGGAPDTGGAGSHPVSQASTGITTGFDPQGTPWFYVPARGDYLIALGDHVLSVRLALPYETGGHLLDAGLYRIDVGGCDPASSKSLRITPYVPGDAPRC